MFRNLVSNLSFSPALIGQIGFYARRLSKEEVTRRLGLVMTIFALIVQSFVVFTPSTSANSSNSSDMITGGITSKEQLMSAYDKNIKGFRDIMTYNGITRSELENTTKSSINSRDHGTQNNAWLSWGHNKRFSTSQGETTHNINDSLTVYSRPLWRFDTTSWTTKNGSTYAAFVGNSSERGDFAIIMTCGNLVSQTIPTPPTPVSVCRPGTGIISIYSNEKLSTDLAVNDPACQPKKPTAICQSVTPPTVIDRTHYSFIAKSETTEGATISGYTFKIYDQAGTLITKKVVTSSANQVDSGSIEIKNPGTYRVEVTVATSLGIKSSNSCVTNITVPEEGKVTVCRPGTGIITVKLSEKRSTDQTADHPDCQPKTATCSSIVINKIDRTHISITANASGTADISSYEFIVRKNSASGDIITTKTSNSSAHKVTSDIFEISESGDYYVSVIVKTSVGIANDLGCAGKITVVPPEKCAINPALQKNDPDCIPCPGNPELWHKAPECREVIFESKTAINLTQNSDATKSIANAGDRIQYNLSITNPGEVITTAKFVEDLSDVVEYANIQDNGGGTYNPDKKTLSWDNVQLAPGAKQTRTFVISVPPTIPSTAQGSSEPTSYDCIINNTFGNNIQIKVNCDTPKVVEQTIKQLPSTGPTENTLFAIAVLTIAIYFWARSKQLGSEVRLIRKEFSASAA